MKRVCTSYSLITHLIRYSKSVVDDSVCLGLAYPQVIIRTAVTYNGIVLGELGCQSLDSTTLITRPYLYVYKYFTFLYSSYHNYISNIRPVAHLVPYPVGYLLDDTSCWHHYGYGVRPFSKNIYSTLFLGIMFKLIERTPSFTKLNNANYKKQLGQYSSRPNFASGFSSHFVAVDRN